MWRPVWSVVDEAQDDSTQHGFPQSAKGVLHWFSSLDPQRTPDNLPKQGHYQKSQ